MKNGLVTSGRIFRTESKRTGRQLFFRLSRRRGGGFFVYWLDDGVHRIGRIVDGGFHAEIANGISQAFGWLWARDFPPDQVEISDAQYGMNRHAKELMAKARSHVVYPAGGSEFVVISGSSGEEYLVTDLANSGLQCVCEWSEWHKTWLQPCSHCIAVELWLEQAGNRELALWGSKEDAARQRRPARRVGRDLWTTSRRSL